MDVFISYEHESKSIADNICAVLESKGVRCWYAPRDVYGDYATSIVDAIEHCRVFILILNHNSSNSPHVLNEVEMAYQRILNGEITIVPFKVDEGILSKAMEYYVKRLHWIDAVSAPLEQAINQLYEQLVPILGIKKEENPLSPSPADTNINRKHVQYYTADDAVETERLVMEERVLFDFEEPVYDKLLFGKEGLTALDFSVLNPYSTIHRLGRSEFSKVIALSYDENVVKAGNELCEAEGKIKFFKVDGSDDLDAALKAAMRECGVESFDFLNLTMAIMDLGNPFKVLKKVKKLLSPDALCFVRDIDDGIVFAYPDENGYFAEIKEFYKLDTLSGSRHSARQVYNIMKKLGAKDIRFERCGVSTASMDYNHKRMLFESWFGFIPNDFRHMARKNPNDAAAKEVLAWLDDKFDDIEEEFFGDDFLFNAGYMIFTARF